jgi:hypothetical protein
MMLLRIGKVSLRTEFPDAVHAALWSNSGVSDGTQRVIAELPADLVRRLRQAAVSSSVSVPSLMSRLLDQSLTSGTPTASPVVLAVRPLVEVAAMGPALEFWQAMGAHLVHGDPAAHRSVLTIGGIRFVLTTAPGDRTVDVLPEPRAAVSTEPPAVPPALHVQLPDGRLLSLVPPDRPAS